MKIYLQLALNPELYDGTLSSLIHYHMISSLFYTYGKE